MLEDTTALVTGASQGIGREIAVAFAEAGATVTLAARGDGIHDTAELIDDPERTLAVHTDVTDDEAVEAAVESTVEEFGDLTCVVNNAGIAGPMAPLEETDPEEWAHVLDVNVVGCQRTIAHAAPHLRAAEGASVINIASIGGKRPYPNRAPYAASKMAVIGLTRTAAFEFGEDEVSVNAICPGPVEGDRIQRAFEGQAELRDVPVDAVEQQAKRRLAVHELVPPEEVAAMAVHLAGADSHHVTGQDINISSGGAWY